MPNLIKRFLTENKTFIVFLLLMSVFRSALADWNVVPTGSMLPTIVEGDRILVNKMAYDLRVPFTHLSLVKVADPERGDIIIFDSEVSGIRLVKRVLAVPGDRVSMHHNQIVLNGAPLAYSHTTITPFGKQITESIPSQNTSIKGHSIRISNEVSSRSSFNELTIPENYYLALGDNRDNSADSRVIGLIPREEIVGRTRSVVMSLDYEDNYLPRKARFMKTL